MKDAFGVEREGISKKLWSVDEGGDVYGKKGQKIKAGANDKYLRSKGELKAVNEQSKKDLPARVVTGGLGATTVGASGYALYQATNKGDAVKNLKRAKTANKIGAAALVPAMAGSVALGARQHKAANEWRGQKGLAPRSYWSGKPKEAKVSKAFMPKKLPTMGDIGGFKDALGLQASKVGQWAGGMKATATSPGQSTTVRAGGKVFKPGFTKVTQNPSRVSQAAGSKASVTGKGTAPTFTVKTSGGGLTGKAKAAAAGGAGIGAAGLYGAKKKSSKPKTTSYYPNKY